jgi:hypothetical protein
MSEALSFAEVDGQHVELLPARTVLSCFNGYYGGYGDEFEFEGGDGGWGGDGYGGDGGDGGHAIVADNVNKSFFGDQYNVAVGGHGGHGGDGWGGDANGGDGFDFDKGHGYDKGYGDYGYGKY